jgi:16S rRNA (guanine527-N7)-methyltransferase
LTAIIQPQEVAVKHFIDSLFAYEEEYFPLAARVCDVGTGAGFPGLPLKIYRPDLRMTLLDSTAKKLAFLDRLLGILKISGAETLHSRAEDAGRVAGRRESYDLALARAVAPLNVLCEYCLPLVKPGGLFIALKARQTETELSGARAALRILGGEVAALKPVRLPALADERVVVYIRKLRPTAVNYPRKAGLPEKKPLT